jgi:prolipoprotein diacylglyceryltransferase
MNQNFFDRTDYVIFVLGIIFISFGITIPVGILLFILLISRKVNQNIKNNNKTFSTSFFN